MKTLLVAIDAKYIHTNVAIRLLKTNADFPVDLLETNIKDNIDDVFKKIIDFSPDVIGFSVYIWNLTSVMKLTERVKSISDKIIIWGGPEVCHDYEYFLSVSPVDYIATGEGELTFNIFLHALDERGDMQQVPGLAYRKFDGIVATLPSPFVDLATLKSPYRSQDDIPGLPNRIQYLESSRGCPFHCSYCLASLENKVRFFPLDKVKDDLLFLIENGANTFKFLDRTFNVDNARAIELADFIIRNHRPGNSFQFEITGEILADEFIDFINKNAPKHLFRFEIGIQSTNTESNLAVRRHQDNEKLFAIIRKIQLAGVIDLHLDLIAGLPYEDIFSFAKTFDSAFLLRAKELQLGFLKLLRGTSIRKNSDVFGYRFNQNPPYEIFESKWLSLEDITTIRQVEQMLNIYWNKNFMPNTVNKITECKTSMFRFFADIYLYCDKNGINLHRYQLSDVFKAMDDFLNKNDPLIRQAVFPLLKYDYLSYHTIKPKIWWEENKSSRRKIFEIYMMTNNNYTLEKLYKYGVATTYGDAYLLVMYLPKGPDIMLFDNEGKKLDI